MTRSVRFRFFVLAKDESLYALSCKTLDHMTSRAISCALPDYSGTELRIAQVRVENIGKTPTRMLDVLCSTLPINAKGFVDHDTSDARASDAFAAVMRGTSRAKRPQAWSPSPKQRAALREAALGRCRLPYFRI